MHPSDDPHSVPDSRPARRPLFVPVVIAAVFLAVIGASAGAVLANRARGANATGSGDSANPATATYDVGANRSGPPCRSETQRQAEAVGASGSLRVELAIKTATSAAWICSDDAGRLFYHANRLNKQDAWIEGRTALFIADVIADGDAYRASTVDAEGRSTTFVVSPESLLIIHKDGTKEVQRVVGS